MYSLEQTRPQAGVLRLAAIALTVLLMALSARVTIEIGNLVPFTLQVMVVLLAGLVLGARDAALSMLAYLALIAMGSPLDARALGSAALFGPTGGYLIGFVFAAGMVGLLAEGYDRSGWSSARLTERGQRLQDWAVRYAVAALGIAVIYLFGVRALQLQAGLSLGEAWLVGGAPFWWLDLCKAAVAVSLAEGGRQVFMRLKQGSMM